MVGRIPVVFAILTAIIATTCVFVLNPWLKKQGTLSPLWRLTEANNASFTPSITESSTKKPYKEHTFETNNSSDSNNIRILLWSKNNVRKNLFITYRFLPPQGGFDICKLPNGKTCEAVEDKNFYNQSDVILFHGKSLRLTPMPKYRFSHQKWLFYEYETPPNTWGTGEYKNKIQNVFNLTATKTMDSDIPIVELHQVCSVDSEKLKNLERNNTNYAQGKGNRVAWFVSHCKTQSKRELYARELSKYIPVDIYGRCGKLNCGTNMNRGECDKTVINKQYKFYLSFENSLCENYVTEKLWRFINEPITAIPIVMGAMDYTKMLPKLSYLNIKDYSSPKALAEHLKRIDANDTAFNEMIKTKNSLSCRHPSGKPFHEIAHQCLVCRYLHEHRYEMSFVPNVVDFWSTAEKCISPNKFYNGSWNV